MLAQLLPPDTITCHDCGTMADDDGRRGTHGLSVCDECIVDRYWTCDACDALHAADDECRAIRGETLCPECYGERYVTCEGCSRTIERSAAEPNPDDRDVCHSCWCDDYFICDGCDACLPQDEYGSDGYCRECEPADDDCDLIRDHDERAEHTLEFFGEPKDGMFYGVELEVEVSDGHDVSDAAYGAQHDIGDDFAILKSDGSLNCGFEIVSAPATLEIHRARWSTFLGLAHRGLRSWDTGTCGMHVHASRSAITPFALGKLLVFINHPDHGQFIRDVAGRDPHRWAKTMPKKVSDAKRRGGGDRYQAINLTNDKTIEFRIFRGTMKRESFLKNLEFVDASIRFARWAGLGNLTVAEFCRFVGSTPKRWPSLSAWLRAKGLITAPKPNRKPSSVA